MEFKPKMAADLPEMDALIFRDAPMGLQHRSPLSLDERLHYDEASTILYVNFEGLSIETVEDVSKLTDYLDQKLASFGKRVNVIVNYDNF